MNEPSHPDVLALARWLELAEADGVSSAVRAAIARGVEGLAVHELGSARLVDAGPGSHLNRVYGFGFDGEPDPALLDEVDARCTSRPARIELSPYAAAAWLPLLRERGYGVEMFRDVLFRPLDGELPAPPAGVHVREVEPDEVDSAVHLVGRGFSNGAEPPASETQVGQIVSRAPGTRTFVASVAGEPAGGASFASGHERIVLLGASTLPEHRRRGVQTALMVARLAAGRELGARLATVQAAPGVATRRNAERLGFRLAYTRVTVCRP